MYHIRLTMYQNKITIYHIYVTVYHDTLTLYHVHKSNMVFCMLGVGNNIIMVWLRTMVDIIYLVFKIILYQFIYILFSFMGSADQQIEN